MHTTTARAYTGTALAAACLLLAALFTLPFLSRADATSTPPSSTASTDTPAPDTSTPASSPAVSGDSGSGAGDASITTGDAAATAASEDDANTNITGSTTGSTTPASAPADTASTTPDTDTASTTSATATTTCSSCAAPLTVTDANAATTTSTTTAAADTGNNTATSTGGGALIKTGDAYASATSINIINANIVDSAGLLYFADLFGALGIDIRALDLSYFLNGGGSCGCTSAPLTVTNQNAATTTSSTGAVATTGANVVHAGADGSIQTGDAYASANSVNIVNTNIVNSSYLLVALNDFGNLAGDLVLPGANFFEQLLARGGAGAGVTATTNNTATVTSDTSATADSGGNTATSTSGGASIATGDALASATSVNQVNTNQVGGTSVFLLFRIFGSFSGAIQGLPAGLSWQQTPAGLVITNADGSPVAQGTLASLAGPVSADASNTASVGSSARAYALTGANEAAGGSASITTGAAYAAANSVNIVNTNLLGTNWIFAIFNIFGNVGGAIAFGHPNLWVGTSVDAPSPTMPGAGVTYHVTVANRGDAAATGVTLTASYPAGLLAFTGGTAGAGQTTYALGTLAPGEAKDFTYTATAGSVPAGHSVPVPLTAAVTSDETDDNPADNTDHLSLVVTEPGGVSRHTTIVGVGGTPHLAVTKRASVATTTAPAKVGYTVDVTNSGGPALGARATDVLSAPDGTVVSTQSWDLGDINNGDDVRITYDALFATSSAPGVYHNTVTVAPIDASSTSAFASVSAGNALTIEAPAVLAAATCAPYLTGYILPGGANNPDEVAKLQAFLQKNGTPGLAVSGVYDRATQNAVKTFQEVHAASILAPWGVTKPTGAVYYTTEQAINELNCADGTTFALTDAQQAEIAAYARHRAAGNAPAAVVGVATPAPKVAEEAPAPTPATPVPAPVPTPRAKGSWFARLLYGEASLMQRVLATFAPSASAAGE